MRRLDMRQLAGAVMALSLTPLLMSADGLDPLCTDILTIPRRTLLVTWKLRETNILLDGSRVCSAEEPTPGFARCSGARGRR